MRFYLLFLIINITQVLGSNTYSQSVTFSLNMSNTSIEDVLNTIEEQSEYRFLYNKRVVDVSRKVNISANNENIVEVLDELFKNTGFAYAISDRQIVLNKKEALFSTSQSQQTGKQITGTVTDERGEPIIGGNVIEKGTTNGVITDMDGKFSLTVQENAVLQVSYIGYIGQEINIGNQNNLSILLREDSQALEEVVVIGYGTIKKRDLTGAVTSMGGENISSRKTIQVSQALQGAMPGVLVTRDNNAPGATANIRVRGITTIGESNPLIIVDGMQVDNINDIHPNDIENISVLKDAASASIYGSQAAAGVILITTKRAQADNFSLEYNYEYGMEIPTLSPAYVDATRYMQMTNELRWNDAGNGNNEYPTYAKDIIDNYSQLNQENPDKYPITDWVSMMLKSYAPRQTHTLKIAGGNNRVRTSASFTYDNIDALYDGRTFERIMSRVNNDLNITNYLSASLDINYKHEIVKQPAADRIMYRIRLAAPVYPATWSDGRLAEGKIGDNIYGQARDGGFNNGWYNQLGAKIGLSFTPIEGLKISGNFSPTFNFNKNKIFQKAVPFYLADDPAILGGYIQRETNLSEKRSDDYRLTTQFLATYTNAFGNHSMNMLAGYEDRYEFNEELGASRNQYDLENYPYLDIGPLELRDNSGKAYEYARRSFFGRIMYDYQNKYLLQANIRYDASSRFANNYRWGAFPSVSAGWVATEEKFFPKNTVLSFLKLRASWGTLGNERIGNYPYQATIEFDNALFLQGGEVVSQQAAAQYRYAIRNITWETTESYDIGIDAYFMDNRLRFSGDYYKKKTKDMLLAIQIPTYMGFGNPDQNTGKMHTKGWELEAGWNDKIGDINYSISFNLSDFKSIMGNLGGTEFLGDKIRIEGSEFDEWYGYRCLGIYQTKEQVDNSALTSNSVKVGDLWYEDISGPDGSPDGRISAEYDRVFLGGSLPRYMYGGNLQMNYKNLGVGITFQGVGKQHARIERLMVEPLAEDWGNIPALLDGKIYSHYNTAEQNIAAQYPRLTRANRENNYAMSDFWLFNGRYFRLKNINIDYTFPEEWAQKIALKNIRAYISVSDLFCINKYPKGWDPEMGTSSYPITTSVIFGLSVKF